MNKMVIVGRVGSPHGVRGWSKLFSYTHPAKNIASYQYWHLKREDQWEPVDMSALHIDTGNGSLMRVKFPGCESPEAARAYTNLLIGIPRDQLPKLSLGDYYWSDLEGWSVVNQQGIVLGKVSHLFSTGANDVLVVKGDRERLLPYIKDVILEVDLEKEEIKVDWEADF